MNYQKFIHQLRELYVNWGQASVRPKSDVFQSVLEQVSGMTTANVMQLLNFAVECMEPDEIYCEIGCFQGATLIGALLNNSAIAYAVDNFSEFDTDGENLKQLTDNLEAFELAEKVFFFNQDFEEFFWELRELQPEQKIGVYFYDGAHDYRSQLLGLLLAKPFLAEKALIIVDDSNCSEVQQANWDFMAAHRECQLLLNLPTPKNEAPTFWYGLQVFSWDLNSQADYNWSEFSNNFRYQPLIEAFYDFHLEFEFKQKPARLAVLEQEALAFHSRQELCAAEAKYQEILSWDRNQATAYHNLAMIYFQQERYDEALTMVQKSVEINPEISQHHYSLGLVLEKLGNISQAISAYQQAIARNNKLVEAYNNLGNIFLKAGNLDAAEAVYRQGIEANPDYFMSYVNLGNILVNKNQIDEGIKNYEIVLKLNPGDKNILNNMAIAILQMQNLGWTQRAIEIAERLSSLVPKYLFFQLAKYLILPIIYENEQEISFSRSKFIEGLEKIVQHINLVEDEDKNNALIGIEKWTNFYLQYQCKDDLKMQRMYGQLVHKIMSVNYPEWSKPLGMHPLKVGEKIRIGYISAFLRDHNGANWATGWVKNHDKEIFDVRCYYTGKVVDEITQDFKFSSEAFHHIPENREALCQQIISDKLHILIYTDLGMDSPTSIMAGLRLAPIQCMAWGHPVTSGLPTMDYYISSRLMEPENAQAHYSEKLVTLPNLAVFYNKPVIPKTIKNRAKFQLQDDAIIYLSPQSLFKYLPQHDYLFPRIARRVPQAQFVFIEFYVSGSLITDKFRQRLQTAFAQFGLNSEDYCLILPRLNPHEYLNLNLVADIFLDTLSWSGDNTTKQAIACNLPVVTCPGEFMRGRHSYGILKMLGVTETIAKDEAEYIEMAVRLGLDTEWRQSIVEKIKQNSDRLYNDKTCVEALDKFYQNLVMETQTVIKDN